MAHNHSYPELYVAHRLSAEHDFNLYFVFYVLIILHKLFLTPYVFTKMWRCGDLKMAHYVSNPKSQV